MVVAQLKKILNHVEDDAPVLIEYMTSRHEYVTEFAMGVRIDVDMDDDDLNEEGEPAEYPALVILGITEDLD